MYTWIIDNYCKAYPVKWTILILKPGVVEKMKFSFIIKNQVAKMKETKL